MPLKAVAKGAGAAQVFGVVHRHAGGALHQRLDDQRRSLGVMPLQVLLQRLRAADGEVMRTLACLGKPPVRTGHSAAGPQQRRVGIAEEGAVGYPQRAERFAGVASSQAEQTVLARPARVAPAVEAQLQRYSDALENDLTTGRDKIATRVREAVGYEQSFAESSNLLMTHLKDRPECRDLVEELATRERDKGRAGPSTMQGD